MTALRLSLLALCLLLAGPAVFADKLEGEAARNARNRAREIKRDWGKLTKAEKLPLLIELGRLPESSVAKFLEEVIDTEGDDDTAAVAARALARHAEPGDARTLMRLYNKAKTPERRAACLRWLGAYGDKAPLTELRKLAMGDDATAEAAVHALADIAGKDALSTVETAAMAGKTTAARRAATQRLVAMGDRRGMEALDKQANLEDAAFAAHAALGTEHEPEAIERVLKLVGKRTLKQGERPHLFGSLLARLQRIESHEIVLKALPNLDKGVDIETGWWAVSVCRAQPVFSAASRWLSDDQPLVILNGLRLLQRAPQPFSGAELERATEALGPLLDHADEDVAIHALLACAATGACAEAMAERVAKWLADEAPLRRAAALLVAGAAHAPRAIALLKDEAWFVVSAALDCLLRAHPREAAPAAFELATRQGEGRLFAEAIALLVDLTGQDFGDNLERWQRWLTENAEFTVKPRALGSLRGVPYQRLRHRTAPTFYGLSIESTNVQFCVDRSISMINPVSREPNRPDFAARKADVIRRRPEVQRSMRDGFLPRFHVAAGEVAGALDGMSTSARFGITLFSHELSEPEGGRAVNSPDERRRIGNWMLSTTPQGGTDIQAALLHVIRHADADTVVLLSDGEPTSIAILEQVHRANAVRRLNILVVSIHEDVAYRHYMQAMAEREGGRLVDGEPRE